MMVLLQKRKTYSLCLLVEGSCIGASVVYTISVPRKRILQSNAKNGCGKASKYVLVR